jgi:exodeoxyribonuclease III
MKILTWNIQHGGQDHAAIAAALLAHDADVIVLSEHQAQRTRPLMESLREAGLGHVVASPTEGRRNGVAVLSKQPIESRPSPFGQPPFAWWGAEGQMGTLSVIGVYAPLSNSWGSSPEIQRAFWSAVHQVTDSRRDEPLLIIGDFNTCGPVADGPTPLLCSDAFQHLTTLGWVDAWRAVNGSGTDFSWVQRRITPPTHWRIDHAFVSPVLARAVRACHYSHPEREAGLSDHSMLILEVA